MSLVWYFTYYKDNFLGVQVYPVFTTMLFFYVGIQVAILLFQGMFGSRCLVPKVFQPAKYNYHRAVPEDVFNNTAECVICMLPIDEPSPYAAEQGTASADSSHNLENGEIRSNISPDKYMLTPCNHLFHTECLTQWMNEKMECPTCRGHLPVP